MTMVRATRMAATMTRQQEWRQPNKVASAQNSARSLRAVIFGNNWVFACVFLITKPITHMREQARKFASVHTDDESWCQVSTQVYQNIRFSHFSTSHWCQRKRRFQSINSSGPDCESWFIQRWGIKKLRKSPRRKFAFGSPRHETKKM